MAVYPSQKSKLERIQAAAKSAAQTVSPTKNYLSAPQDIRPFILMKNKVEENSKQLKHDVAQ